MKAKANSIITTEMNFEAGTITFTVLGVTGERQPIVLDLNAVHDDNKTHAAFHGFKQRLPDAAAIARNTETGASASPDEKYDAMRELADHYMSGSSEWSRRGSGGQGAESGLTLRAIAQVKGCTVPEARAMVDAEATKQGKKPAAILAILRTNAKVREAMDAMRAEAASGIDTEELLNNLA